MKLNLIGRNEKARMIQKKSDVHQGQHSEMKTQEGTEMLQKERKEQERRVKKGSAHVTSGLSFEENSVIELVWGESRENSIFHCNP